MAAVCIFPAGCYGKLPARGDFLTRGLPPMFVHTWDGWLQQAMQASRERLGNDWLECYLSAPLWEFLLPPGMVAAQAVAGVLCPSVDRIGRHFPFTIAALLGPEPVEELSTFLHAKNWFACVGEVALAGLAPALDVEAYGRRLENLGFPGAARAISTGRAVARGRERHLHAALKENSCEQTLRLLLEEIRPAYGALWLNEGSESVPDCALATDGLPAPERFAAMLDGRWTHHGWRETTRPDARQPARPDA